MYVFILPFYLCVESGIHHEVIAAVDINDHANAIYRHNFPGTKLMQRCIEVCVYIIYSYTGYT